LDRTVTSPKNWSRAMEVEESNPHLIYYWDHTRDMTQKVTVREQPVGGEGEYGLYHINDMDWKLIASSKAKDDLRREAVRWMRKHPNP